MKEKILFFGVFYIILGTLGLTIPSISYYLTNHVWPLDDISIGLITIVVSTVGYSTAEKIIVLRGKKSNLSEMLWNLVALVLSIVLTIFVVIFLGNEVICFPLILSCLAYIFSCILWWYQNRDNDNFNKNIGENALGGSPEQFN